MEEICVGLIYLATNRITRKKYVGQTIKTKAIRWAEHCRAAAAGSPYAIHRAIRKHGAESFTVRVLKRVTSPLLNAAEVYFIARHKAFGPMGYSMTTGGEGGKLSLLARRRLSRALRKNFKDPAYKVRMTAIHAALMANPDIICKIAASNRKRFEGLKGEAARAESRANCEKRWNKPGAREEASEVQRRVCSTPEQRAARSEWIRYPKSDATKEKLAEIGRARWQDEDYAAKMRRSLNTPTVRSRHSEATRAQMARRTPEQVAATMAKRRATIMAKSPEERAEADRKRVATRRANGFVPNTANWVKAGRAALDALTSEERSAKQAAAWARKTEEERAEIGKKIADTRRANDSYVVSDDTKARIAKAKTGKPWSEKRRAAHLARV